jgi:glycosyltransferase involved in cell wall biosynthesis
VVALVCRRELADFPGIEYIEAAWSKKNWLNRLWCEYVWMKGISKQLSPVYLWLSLHDTTPNVLAEKRAVYCHNSFPFYRWQWKEWLFSPKIVLFALFTKWIYRTNIHKNQWIIVQQEWFRHEFIRMFGLNGTEIVVAPPSFHRASAPHIQNTSNEPYSFFFPAAPDSHKNYQCICRAAELLEKEQHCTDFNVYMTITGQENPYTRWLYKKWGHGIPSLHFTGYLTKESLYGYYARCHCLLFPSKVETWGLPITEFAVYDKPMLLSDLPYAHETAAGCRQVAFFDPDKPELLAERMKQLISGDTSRLHAVPEQKLAPPAARSWAALFDILLDKSTSN